MASGDLLDPVWGYWRLARQKYVPRCNTCPLKVLLCTQWIPQGNPTQKGTNVGNQITVEVNNVNEIILTNNGIVVGCVTVQNISNNGDIEFVGRAVNISDFPSYTHNGFACSLAVHTKNKENILSVDAFNKMRVQEVGA